MKLHLPLIAVLFSAITGCATQTQINQDALMNRAFKVCGVGIDSKTADAYRLAFGADKPGELAVTKETSENLNTQIAVLLKQADLKSDASLKIVAEEMGVTRECLLNQLQMQIPVSKADMLEQCRLDVTRKIAPHSANPNFQTSTDVVTFWNQESKQLSGNDIVPMTGFFNAIVPRNSFSFKALCDLRGGKFNESVIEKILE